MSKYTKGKIEIVQVSVSTYQIWAKPKPNHKAILIASNLNEDDATELVRRYNAFEEGGIVSELRMACDEGLYECERTKINCTCEHKDLGGLLRRIERIESAIAKANPE